MAGVLIITKLNARSEKAQLPERTGSVGSGVSGPLSHNLGLGYEGYWARVVFWFELWWFSGMGVPARLRSGKKTASGGTCSV